MFVLPHIVQGSRMLGPRLGFIWRRKNLGYQHRDKEQMPRISTETPNRPQCEALRRELVEMNTRGGRRYGGLRCTAMIGGYIQMYVSTLKSYHAP